MILKNISIIFKHFLDNFIIIIIITATFNRINLKHNLHNSQNISKHLQIMKFQYYIQKHHTIAMLTVSSN